MGQGLENSRRRCLILKARQAYHAYRDMLHYYALRNLTAWLEARPQATLRDMASELAGPRCREWVSLGGQLVPSAQVDALREEIRSGGLDSWPHIHAAYDRLWEAYPLEKQRHALATLLDLLETERLTPVLWQTALDEAVRIQRYVRDQVLASRKKDYDDPFRRSTFRNAAEMQAVVGTAEGNSFVAQVRRETEAFEGLVERLAKRG